MSFRYESDTKKFELPLRKFQCLAEDENGKKCGAETYVFLMCPKHAAEHYDVAVRPSLIPNAGLGLFALRDFKKNEILTPPYTGEILSNRTLNSRYGDGSAPYTLELKRDMYTDASAHRCWAAFINHTKHKKANTKFAVFREVANVRATKDIPAGTELLVDYGDDYFRYSDKVTTKTTFPAHFEAQLLSHQ